MRLDFNVLWVDDQPDRIASSITSIKRQMEEEGFHFNPKLCQTIDEVKALVGDGVFADEVDLILVDWDLGGGAHGEDAIKAARDEIKYKDVVFYSGRPANELKLIVAANSLEGVYCAGREELVEEVMGVFESLVKKVLDLDHARGIVMGATSDIDFLVNQCLTLMHAKLDADGQAAMLKDILSRIEGRLKDLTKRVEKLQKDAVIDALFKSHEIFTSNDRLRILAGMLEQERFKPFAETQAGIKAYLKAVVPGRTTLAHLVLVPEGKPQSVTDTAGTVVTLQQTQEMRRQILGLRGDFRNLVSALEAMK